jgi:hypothetical protein
MVHHRREIPMTSSYAGKDELIRSASVHVEDIRAKAIAALVAGSPRAGC